MRARSAINSLSYSATAPVPTSSLVNPIEREPGGRGERPILMNHPFRTFAVFVVFALAAVACGSDEAVQTRSSGERDAAGESLDGDWVLVSGTVDGSALALDEDYRITMSIDGSEIGGTAACNSYGGSVSIDDGTFSIGEVSQTERGCEPAIMELESAFLQGLFKANSAVRSADTASITGEGVDYTFEVVAPVPVADLVGTTWVLDTLISGITASSTVSSAEPATLVLVAEGTFTGGTGCRTISGDYVISGDVVQFTSFGADGECGVDVADQDGQVVSVLGDGFTVEIDGDRLTATAAGGEGLSYKAKS